MCDIPSLSATPTGYALEYLLGNSKGNQPQIFTGRTDTEAPILWPPDVKSLLIGKDLNAGKVGR